MAHMDCPDCGLGFGGVHDKNCLRRGQAINLTDGPNPLVDRPPLRLTGQDGNAFFILGLARHAAKKASWTKEQTDAVMEDARSGDYQHLLKVLGEHFDIS